MKVVIVHRGNLLVDFLNSTGAIHDVSIQVSIGKSKIILISFSTQPIGRDLAYQVDRQKKLVPNLDDFMHHQISERAKIAGAIAKLGRISHIVFRAVAGISNTSAVRQRLRNSIEGRHTDTGGGRFILV